MDKERAKFILESFRPDGADAGDADFAEALRFATSDRELGAWLMRERAFDAEFAEALARVDLPVGLREKVLLGMVQDSEDALRVDLKGESEMIRAMAGIEVPGELRERILVAMEQTAKSRVEAKSWSWAKFGIPLAAAAGIAFAFVSLRESHQTGELAEMVNEITISEVEAGFFRAYEAPLFSLDVHNDESGVLLAGLREQGLPVSDSELPPGLEHLKGLGCRELVIDGKRGTLVCFDTGKGALHLVTFRRCDVSCDLPGVQEPEIRVEGEWAMARWEDKNNAYTLIGRKSIGSLNSFF